MASKDASAPDSALVSAKTAEDSAQAEMTETAPGGVVEIAPDGDLILVVGKSDDMVKFKVHSLCLKLASKVFTAMFGPNWAEGKALSKDNPKEIALPEDDPVAMRKICQILHQQIEALADEVLTVAELAHLALAADKYDVVHLLSRFCSIWMDNIVISTTEDRLICLSAVSYFTPGNTWKWMFELVSLEDYSFNYYTDVPLL